MLIDDFSGGQNTRVTPSKIFPYEAQIYTNIDSTSGALVPLKDRLVEKEDVDAYFTFYEAASEWVSEPSESCFVEFKEKLYRTKADSYPTKYDGTNEYRLGIVKPTTTPSLADGGAGNLTGTYSYCYTYYNSSDGTESQPSSLSSELAVTSKQITVSGLSASTDAQVDKIRLYRIGGDLASYTLVVEKINDSSNYTDNNADVDIASNVTLQSADYKEAPTNLKYLTEAYAMLFGCLEDKLYFSEIGEPNYWPSSYFIDFESNVTGIGAIQNGLIVCTKYRTYIVTGNSPTTFTKYLLSDEQGCLRHYTMRSVNNNLLWLSNDGICSSSGGNVDVITQDKLGKLNLTNPQNAAVYDRVYYLTHANGLLCVDFRFGLVVRNVSSSVAWIGTHQDHLYAQYGRVLYRMFSSPDNLTIQYKSPVYTEESYSNWKIFKDFYIRYTGDLTVNVYVDSVLMNTFSLTGDGCENLKVDTKAKGYGLELEITGTGTVYEIEWKAQGRQNGR